MAGCPRCKFISDPLSGDIYDVTFPCPKCGHGGAKVRKPALGGYKARKPKGGFGGLGNLSFSSRVTSVAKLAGIGAAFYFSRKALNEIDNADTSRDRKIKNMLGEMLPSIKRATFYIPAYAVPHAVELATNKEYPILGTVYALGVSYMMVTAAADPILSRVGPAKPAVELS
jgi:hypothetical protein